MTDARTTAMADAYRAGDTLDAIGKRYGITRQRVQQIIAGRVTTAESKASRAAARAREDAHDRAYILLQVEDDPTVTFAQAVEASEVGYDRALTLFTEEERRALFATPLRKEYVTTTPDEALYASMRAAAGEYPAGHVLTGPQYNRSRHKLITAVAVLHRHDNKWTAALAAAGLPVGEPRRRTYVRGWSDAEMRAWVREFVRENPGGAYKAFEVWCRGRAGCPSAASVRVRLGAWAAVRNVARVELAESDTTPG